MAAAGREAHPGHQVVAEAEALLLVGVDAVAAAGGHVLHPEEVLPGRGQAHAAAFAQVRRRFVAERVKVAAGLAQHGPAGELRLVALALDRQDDLVDHVAGALVVEDAARAELGDGEEARAAQELVAAAAAAAGVKAASGNRGKL